MEIIPENFEIYRDLILSGQIEQTEVPKLMDDNPAFAMWYRLKDRHTVTPAQELQQGHHPQLAQD
jgi:hypothetical protein